MRKKLRHLRERFDFGTIAVEVFSVVLAVLLALGVNEWREARSDRQLAETALANICQEVQRNREQLAARQPYHAAMRDSMRNYTPELRQTGFDDLDLVRLGMMNGPNFAVLYSSAWQTGTASEALAHIDYETRRLLFSTYETQQLLDGSINRFGAILLTPQSVQSGNLYYALTLSQMILGDIVMQEEDLLQLYGQFTERSCGMLPSASTQAASDRSAQP